MSSSVDVVVPGILHGSACATPGQFDIHRPACATPGRLDIHRSACASPDRFDIPAANRPPPPAARRPPSPLRERIDSASIGHSVDGAADKWTAVAREAGYVQQPHPTMLPKQSDRQAARGAIAATDACVSRWLLHAFETGAKVLRGEGKKELYSTNNCPTAIPRPGNTASSYIEITPDLPQVRLRPDQTSPYVSHTNLYPD
ncbi:hypothetical protein PMIN01_09548 [Paraphaeosphaeria minitans]|uniref:Uncharacterized protein n=1 Tax=Paraphaeosphaeria minitans TaxID=565426 RepID=A0A9P6GCV3_9PLEO|nr:hypothetical protein PMIN01_09548 [Paraphaeosphaeria minitans]